MGAWGIRPFENDTALDFVADFEDNMSFSYLRRTVEAVITEDYLEADQVIEAIAAMELIAAIKGNPSDDFPDLDTITLEDLQEKYESKVSNYSLSLCEDALSVIKREEDNELFELWDDADASEEWLTTLEDLEDRLF